MPDPIPEPEVLSYDTIRDEVDDFIAEFDIAQSIPIDIEQIADVALGLDIVPVPGLRATRGIEGYLSADLSSIYLDESFSAGPVLHRHRFTLAHEIGHWYLHDALYTAAANSKCESFADFINSIPEKSWLWYEWQARAFAGLLLVPRPELARVFREAVDHAKDVGFDFDPNEDAHKAYAAEWIGKRFGVSGGVILVRAGKDGLW